MPTVRPGMIRDLATLQRTLGHDDLRSRLFVAGSSGLPGRCRQHFLMLQQPCQPHRLHRNSPVDIGAAGLPAAGCSFWHSPLVGGSPFRAPAMIVAVRAAVPDGHSALVRMIRR